MDINRVKLDIRGVKYFINTDESVEYTEALGKRIDERMAEIMKGGSFVTMTQAAVLVALEFADELSKSEKNVENFRNQIKDYLEDSAKAKSERDYYKRELERIKTEAKFKNDQINLFAKSENKNNDDSTK
ncbi:MAG: cell division protein ZapA [Candidatus Fimenecus sp.]